MEKRKGKGSPMSSLSFSLPPSRERGTQGRKKKAAVLAHRRFLLACSVKRRRIQKGAGGKKGGKKKRKGCRGLFSRMPRKENSRQQRGEERKKGGGKKGRYLLLPPRDRPKKRATRGREKETRAFAQFSLLYTDEKETPRGAPNGKKREKKRRKEERRACHSFNLLPRVGSWGGGGMGVKGEGGKRRGGRNPSIYDHCSFILFLNRRCPGAWERGLWRQ